MAKAPKAEKVPQDENLGNLPAELIVDGQVIETETSAQMAVDASSSNTDSDDAIVDDADDDNIDDDEDAQDDVDLGMRHVVVLKGNTIRHNGESYGEYSNIKMDEADAERVVTLGKAEYLKTFREKAARSRAGVIISGG